MDHIIRCKDSVLVRLAAMTVYHRLDDLNNRHLFSHNSGCRKSTVMMLAEASVEAADDAFSLCLHMPFSLCTYLERKKVWCLFLFL